MLLSTVKADYCTDCVEFRPSCRNDFNVLAVGLYELVDAENQRRSGGVEIINVYRDEGFCLETIKLWKTDAGILNLRWLSETRIICCGSDGKFNILNYEGENIFLCAGKSFCDDGMLLCLENDCERGFLSGDNRGYAVAGDFEFIDSYKFRAHDAEIWTVAFDQFDTNCFFTGADDCMMATWDRRQPSTSSALRLKHSGGVTAICSTDVDKLIWTGSYDDQLRLWDLRQPKTPSDCVMLDGGVWRIKPRNRRLLCACMYNGWCLVDQSTATGGSVENLSIKHSETTGGESILYGVDWWQGDDNLLAACSFYDKQLYLYDIRNLT